MAFKNNYTLGRGEIYFARLDPVTGIYGGERYIGNTSEVNLSAAEEKLDHFSSDRGIRVKDATVSLQVDYTGTLSCDNINVQNVGLFFLGSSESLTIAQSTVTDEPVSDVEVGMFYQLGMTASNISGARAIVYPGVSATLFVVKKGATTLLHGTDYTLNAELGRIEILEGGAIVDGDDLLVTYTVAASTRSRVISGTTAIKGALRYISYNPEGDQRDFYAPYVTLSPNGDFPLKSDEWQTIPFNIEITKRDDDTDAIVWDDRATTV
jgi:hypothetical protein